ncbi:MAG: HNH endonuclease [Myxococcota bacterium]
MRYLRRHALPDKQQQLLADEQETFHQTPPNERDVDRSWDNFRRRVGFKPIEVCLTQMNAISAEQAEGCHFCMYCECNEGAQIDHFWPKATFPAKVFEWDNLFLACDICNRGKSKTFPLQDGRPMLLNPVDSDPHPELPYDLPEGRYDDEQATPRGTITLKTFALNRDFLIQARKKEWKDVCRCLNALESALSQHNVAEIEGDLMDLAYPPKLALLQELVYLGQSGGLMPTEALERQFFALRKLLTPEGPDALTLTSSGERLRKQLWQALHP